MSGIKDQRELDEMRKRLYSRGTDIEQEHHNLTDEKINVARDWNFPGISQPQQAPTNVPVAEVAAVPVGPTVVQAYTPEPVEEPPRSHGYRKFILVGTLVIALIGVAAAATIFYFNGKQISADNISLSVTGQNAIGSSETMSMQASVTNQNAVTVQDATLVLRYPDGTRTATEPFKNVYEDRIPIGTLAPGEAKNLPVQVAVYGKENDIKEVQATLEYRIAQSGTTYYKTADPFKFQIISSPVSIQVTTIGKVSAGQPVEAILTVKSNTNKEQKDLLVSATYPEGFTFKEADPKPAFDQNVWKIDRLKPGETATIKINGAINGFTQEKFGINFSVGVANSDNQFMVGSVLAEGRTEFTLENPFISVDIAIDGDADQSVVLQPNRTSQVSLTVKNTLSDTVYDTVVEVIPTGNAFSAASIDAHKGFYDSNKNTLRWDSTNVPELSQLKPGDTRKLDFSITPSKDVNTANFQVAVNVYAHRVADSSAEEQLIGTVTATGKYSSAARVAGQATFMTGPVPPKVGQKTAYLITLVAEASNNNLTNTVVTASLPTYVNWNNDYSGPGTVDFNPTNKQITWNAGDVNAGGRKELSFSVNILPSVSQVGITPILVNDQSLKATDRYTGATLESQSQFISTELSNEAGYADGNGQVTN